MSRLAVIVTAYGPRGTAALRLIADAIRVSTRQPDEVWLMLEEATAEPDDWEGIAGLSVHTIVTPREEDGRYSVIPYSLKINDALDRTDCDYIAYVTDDSLPDARKFEHLAAALDANPEWGVVFSSQLRNGGMQPALNSVVADAHCVIDHTQVMHRRSDDRWPLDVGVMRTGDAEFWRQLHIRFGSFYGVGDALDVVQQTPDGLSAGGW